MKTWTYRIVVAVAVLGIAYICAINPELSTPAKRDHVATGEIDELRLHTADDGQMTFIATIKLDDGTTIDVDSQSWCYWAWTHTRLGDRVQVRYGQAGLWESGVIVYEIVPISD